MAKIKDFKVGDFFQLEENGVIQYGWITGLGINRNNNELWFRVKFANEKDGDMLVDPRDIENLDL